jgi:membrane-anchored glycerophosphoryl diester phosphodiesterase (GDPDase)
MAQKIQFKQRDLAVISEAVKLSAQDSENKIKATAKNFQWWIAAVVLVCVLGFLQLLVAYFQFTSATYKEYSQKTESIESTQKINQELLNQNIKNQEIIIELEKQLLNKK